MNDPAGDEAVAALRDLAENIDAQIRDLEQKRSAVHELMSIGLPLEVFPEFADILDRLKIAYPDAHEVALDKMRVDLVVGLGSSADAGRLQQLMGRAARSQEPALVQLRELDERFVELGPNTPPEEVDALIAGYTDALTEVYSKLALALPTEASQSWLRTSTSRYTTTGRYWS